MNSTKAMAMLKGPGYEGNVPHMYLDVNGYVTIGVGEMISSANAALKYRLYVVPNPAPPPKTVPDKGKKEPVTLKMVAFDVINEMKSTLETLAQTRRATNAEVIAEYNLVHGLSPGYFPTYYGKFTKLEMFQVDIDSVCLGRIKEFEATLKSHFSGWDKFPEAAQLALFDMLYTLGETGFFGSIRKKYNPNTGKTEEQTVGGFPTLIAAAIRHHWAVCAANCDRGNGPGPKRNADTKGRFLYAAKHDKPIANPAGR